MDGRRLARAGGVGAVALAAEIVGGKEGPIGLIVTGLAAEGERHLVWINEAIRSAARITFNILEESLADTEIPKPKRLMPIAVERRELMIAVDVNGIPQCRAKIDNFEVVGARIEWCESAGCFVAYVRSMTSGEDGYEMKREWWTGKLNLGDCAVLEVLSRGGEHFT